MPYDMSSQLWPDSNERFFSDRELRVIRQSGPHCVSTSLAILTGTDPSEFQGVVNTQDPISWSDKIRDWGMQFAYCPTDARRLRSYIPELIELDDLFALSYYTNGNAILGDPNDSGWVCGSHIVVMHRDRILDPATGTETMASDHDCNECHTKRIFRVVPTSYHRRL